MSHRDHESPASHRGEPVRVYRLGEEPGDDLSMITTPVERLAMVEELSVRMWELTGQPMPSYSRATIPVRVIRLA